MSDNTSVAPINSEGSTAAIAAAMFSPFAAMSSLFDRRASRVQRAAAFGVLLEYGQRHGKAFLNKRKAEHEYTVSIPSNDRVYAKVHDWVTINIEPPERRALIGRSNRNRIEPGFDGDETNESELMFYFDGSSAQDVMVKDFRARVSISRESYQGTKENMPVFAAGGSKTMDERLVFTVESLDARDAVIDLLHDLSIQQTYSPPSFWVSQKYGGWSHRGGHKQRDLETVILPKGVKENVVGDLQTFVDSEKKYIEWGLPYHRGYLFHGPAGTGKTSLAGALATYFNLDVYYISLSALEHDGALMECFNAINDQSVLVIEDIDIVHAARERDDKTSGVTLQGLLNALDGFVTPHGLVTIMTTNNVSVLDPALIRAGRVDQSLEIGFVTGEQISALVKQFIKEDWEFPDPQVDISPAEVVALLNETPQDQAYAAIRRLIHAV